MGGGFAETVKKHMAAARAQSSEEDLSGSDVSDEKAPPADKKRTRAPSDDDESDADDSDADDKEEDEEDDSDSSTAPPGSDIDEDEEDDEGDSEDEAEEVDEDEAPAPAAAAPQASKPSTLSILQRKAAVVHKAFAKHGNLRKAAMSWTHDDDTAKKAFDKVLRRINDTFETMRKNHEDDIEFSQLIRWMQKCSVEVTPFLEPLQPGNDAHRCVVSGDAASHLFTMVSNPRIRYLDQKIEKPSFEEWIEQNGALVTYSAAVRHDCVPCLMGMLQLASFNDIMYKPYISHSETDLLRTFEAVMNLCVSMA
jgi:hypothetical protein